MARARKFKAPKEKATFKDAPETLVKLASDLINEYHTHLAEANIKYLVRTGKWVLRNKIKNGSVVKPSEQSKFLAGGFDFVVTINNDVWNANQDEKKRSALLDHYLCYCARGEDDKITGEPKWYKQEPSVSDFPAIISRHGLWTESLERLFHAHEKYEQQTIIQFDKNKRTGTDN
jgi:hypothetical protein